jgi:hypothetical protein
MLQAVGWSRLGSLQSGFWVSQRARESSLMRTFELLIAVISCNGRNTCKSLVTIASICQDLHPSDEFSLSFHHSKDSSAFNVITGNFTNIGLPMVSFN